jgi:hypothetical protein
MLYRKTLQLACLLTALLGVSATLVAQNRERVRILFAGSSGTCPGRR